MKRLHKILTLSLLAAILSMGKQSSAMAAEEPIAGINTLLEVSDNQDSFYQKLESYLKNQDMYINKSLAFAKVTNYVNIRDKASEEGKIVGKLYDGAAATIEEKKGDWYKIKSGSVEGYVMGDFLLTGDKAIKMADETGKQVATVLTETLRVREKKSTSSSIVGLVGDGEELKVSKTYDDWVKVKLDGGATGYVSKEYVQLDRVYEEAVSIKEEMERLAEEAEALRNQRKQQASSNQVSVSKPSASKVSSSTSSSLGSQIANYSVQFEGNPYVWGGTSLLYGADCSGFVQSIYKHFGVSVPRTSRSQAASGRSISLNNIQVGDLVFYAKNGTINHVAIYLGNGKVISASSPSTGVRITSMYYRTPVKAVTYIH